MAPPGGFLLFAQIVVIRHGAVFLALFLIALDGNGNVEQGGFEIHRVHQVGIEGWEQGFGSYATATTQVYAEAAGQSS